MSSSRVRNTVVFWAVLALTFALILRQQRIDDLLGGSEWRQGDWLINNAAMPVRRGAIGSALIRLSDATGIGLLTLAYVLPAALSGLFLGGIGVLAHRAGLTGRLLLLLLSPGFVLLWANDPEGSLRKEVLAYLAFLPLIASAAQTVPSRGLLLLGLALYAIAVTAHEANAFFAPALITAIWLVHGQGSGRLAVALSAMAVTAGLAVLALGFALTHATLPDSAPVCAALTRRGLVPEMCIGAIAWLEQDLGFARARVAEIAALPGAGTVALSYAAALFPVWVFLHGCPRRGAWFAALALSGLCFLPLWLTAIDWGRWINFHLATLVFLILILLARFRPLWAEAPLPRPLGHATLAVCLLVGINHVGGVLRPGLVPNALTLWHQTPPVR